MRKVWIVVFLMFVTTIVVFGILETSARIWGPQLLPPDQSKQAAHGESLPGEPNLIGDSLVGWRVKEGDNRQFGVPELTHVNSRGLRNPEIPFDSSTSRRILIVGDSSIYGVRVRDRENISGQLEAKLKEKDQQWQVLNGGCPGYSSWQVLQLLNERLLDYKPEWVIVGSLWSDTQGADAPDATRLGKRPMAWKYYSRLYLVTNAWYNRWRWQAKDAPTVGFGLGPVLAQSNRVPIDDYEKNLKMITTLSEASGAKVAFLVLPGIHDVFDGTTGDFREGYREVMRSVAKSKDAPIADMPNLFMNGREDRLFYDDVHPQAIGYSMIADELYRVLQNHLD
jgi:lysophospholipase L1-like esterase